MAAFNPVDSRKRDSISSAESTRLLMVLGKMPVRSLPICSPPRLNREFESSKRHMH